MKRIAIKQHWIWALFALSLGACSTETTENDAEEVIQKHIENIFDTGVLIPRITISADTNQSYALYLPSYYSIKRLWPIIYIFDAHAQSKLPLDLYKNHAEEFGYILVGSNFSKNGIPWETTLNHINNLLKDTRKLLNIAPNRMYALGFSGGARVAVSMAVFKNNLSGVIGCAAGFPKLAQPIKNKFNYLGLVGNSDFNYAEMMHLDEQLKRQAHPHQLIVFIGKHEWPDVATMHAAFAWMELNAMREGLIARNVSVVDAFYAVDKERANEFEKLGHLISLNRQYQNTINFYEDLADLSDTREKLKSLEESLQYLQAVDLHARVLVQEAKINAGYARAMAEKTIDWWDREVGRIYRLTANESNDIKRSSFQRSLAYLGLIAYIRTDASLQQNELEQAKKFLDIFLIVDPENADQPYLQAVWHAKRGENDLVLDALQKAIDMGFDDWERMKSDDVFEPIRGSTKFKELLLQ